MTFDLHIGIDYSGAKTSDKRLSGLQVYAATTGLPMPVSTPTIRGQNCHWTRREIAEWLMTQAMSGNRFIAGIDHAFSFPINYFRRYGLSSWPQFLDDFVEHWPTQLANTCVDDFRTAEQQRTGSDNDFRLTEQWTSSAKSVFRFDVQGAVSKSTHCGLPWLQHIRRQVGDRIHFWPFDGWKIEEGKSVLAEAYPSILRRRYSTGGRTAHQQDAFSIARWLKESDEREILKHYLAPPLTEEDKTVANLEGWILGIM